MDTAVNIPPTQALSEQFNSLIWSCLDAELYRSAVFYAERYFVNDPTNHDARHLYATALLRAGQPHSANHLVKQASESRCGGCLEIKARCCTALGRYRQAQAALQDSLRETLWASTCEFFIQFVNRSYQICSCPAATSSSRASTLSMEKAALFCHSGLNAVKGNSPEIAAISFREALRMNPMLWEAFEGLCQLGVSSISHTYHVLMVVYRCRARCRRDLSFTPGTLKERC